MINIPNNVVIGPNAAKVSFFLNLESLQSQMRYWNLSGKNSRKVLYTIPYTMEDFYDLLHDHVDLSLFSIYKLCKALFYYYNSCTLYCNPIYGHVHLKEENLTKRLFRGRKPQCTILYYQDLSYHLYGILLKHTTQHCWKKREKKERLSFLFFFI